MSVKIIKLVAVFSLVVGLSSCSSVQKPTAEAKVSTLVNDNKTFLVDVRDPAEFNAEKVDGAVNIPLSEIENHLSEFKNKGNIVVYCKTGIRAGKAKALLDKNNIANVYSGTSYQRVSKLKKVNSIKDIKVLPTAKVENLANYPSFDSYGLGLKKDQVLESYNVEKPSFFTVMKGGVLISFDNDEVALSEGDIYELPLGKVIKIKGNKADNKVVITNKI